ADKRRRNYRLTEKGIDLAPVMLEMLIWGAQHEDTGAPSDVIAEMAKNREAVLAETRRCCPGSGGPRAGRLDRERGPREKSDHLEHDVTGRLLRRAEPRTRLARGR